jgi:hypothetical protein
MLAGVAGERDLAMLLRSMRPERRPGAFVFATAGEAVPGAVATVQEDEGLTVVLPQTHADTLGLRYDLVLAMITLRVHSALDAVGLTAAVATALAERSIACNVIAGFHHDHLFVPADRADDAIAALTALTESS